MSSSAGLDRAIAAAGGVRALARALGVVPSAVSNWKRLDGVPAERVPQVARVTRISPHELRPDLFERPEAYTSKTDG